MPIVNKSNGLLAEFAIFPSKLNNQAKLVEQAIQNIESVLKHNVGFSSGTVFRSRDGLRVTSYAQWTNQELYIATQPFADFAIPDVHLFEILLRNQKVVNCISLQVWMGWLTLVSLR